MNFLLFKILRRLSKLNRKNSFNSSYYQGLHDFSKQFQSNNWLLEHIDILKQVKGPILEIGCGNGEFITEAAKYSSHVTGLDWAKSPELGALPQNAEFIEGDATKFNFGAHNKYDLICSADVLEHFPVPSLKVLLDKVTEAAKHNFHVVACYDDGHSHITVHPPEWWLELFRSYDQNYRLQDRWFRVGKGTNECCIITNMPEAKTGE